MKYILAALIFCGSLVHGMDNLDNGSIHIIKKGGGQITFIPKLVKLATSPRTKFGTAYAGVVLGGYSYLLKTSSTSSYPMGIASIPN